MTTDQVTFTRTRVALPELLGAWITYAGHDWQPDGPGFIVHGERLTPGQAAARFYPGGFDAAWHDRRMPPPDKLDPAAIREGDRVPTEAHGWAYVTASTALPVPGMRGLDFRTADGTPGELLARDGELIPALRGGEWA